LQFVLCLHMGVFAVAIFWLVKGHNNWHWRQIFGTWLAKIGKRDLRP
jgi:hypothetical protein